MKALIIYIVLSYLLSEILSHKFSEEIYVMGFERKHLQRILFGVFVVVSVSVYFLMEVFV